MIIQTYLQKQSGKNLSFFDLECILFQLKTVGFVQFKAEAKENDFFKGLMKGKTVVLFWSFSFFF